MATGQGTNFFHYVNQFPEAGAGKQAYIRQYIDDSGNFFVVCFAKYVSQHPAIAMPSPRTAAR
ncbi:hypothetical protein GCM10009413_26140 [Tatumella punctata]